MNPQLHHKWNSERNPSRGSDREGAQILEEDVAKNKVILKQDKPR
jgi:hypothetical protein